MKKKNIRNIALSIVAVVLILLMTVSVTYAWIDDVKLVTFDDDDLVNNGAPLKAGVDINSSIEITDTTNTVDIGNMLTDDDLIFSYTDSQGKTKKHTKYPGGGGSREPNMNTINNNKGYFYESGDMHLSQCYSDGEKFYFKKNGSGVSGYREGNKDDENVNYISFTVQLSSPLATTDFWFKREPKVLKSGDTNTKITQARYAINVDGQSHVYSSSGSATGYDGSSTFAVTGVRKTADYTYMSDSNSSTDRGKNGNSLFTVSRGDTVNLNVKIWLEADNNFSSSITASDIDFELVSSWAYTRKITIIDRTTTASASTWLENHGPKFYVTCPEILKYYAKKIYNTNNPDVDNWKDIPTKSGYSKAPFIQVTKTANSDPPTYIAEIPLCFNNEEMIFYRCSGQGWNKGERSSANANSNYSGDYGVHYWNWWKTYLPNTFVDEKYTLYGSSYDNVAVQGGGGTRTDKGYGTWGTVDEISVYSHYNGVEYAQKPNDTTRLYLFDFSDKDESGETYTYVMYRPNNASGGTPWKCYVPSSSSKIQFGYYPNNSITARWGYNTWTDNNAQLNRQRRPLKATGLYNSNSTVYHFVQHFGGDKGVGYWDGANCAYLIKNSFLSSSSKDAAAHMFNSGTVYLDTTANWRQDNARFAAYFYDGSGNNAWSNLHRVGSTNVYEANVPSGHSWTNVIFARFDPNNSNNTLDPSQTHLWNRTGGDNNNLSFTDGHIYKFSNSDDWDPAADNMYSELYQNWKYPGISIYDNNHKLKYTNGTDAYYVWNGGSTQAAVYKTNDIFGDSIFNRVNFTDNTTGEQIGVNQTGIRVLFPGCFYDIENSTWHGSLDDNKGREVTHHDDAGGGGGTDQSGGSISGYTTKDNEFVFKVGSTPYTVYTNGTNYAVRLTLSAGDYQNWITVLGNYINYGNNETGKHYEPGTGLNITVYKGRSNNFEIRTNTSGDFIVKFTKNSDNINISSILKEGS